MLVAAEREAWGAETSTQFRLGEMDPLIGGLRRFLNDRGYAMTCCGFHQRAMTVHGCDDVYKIQMFAGKHRFGAVVAGGYIKAPAGLFRFA